MYEQPSRPSRTLRRIGSVLIAGGVALLGVSVAVIALTLGPALRPGLTGASYATPLSRTVGLDAGRYVIFERIGSRTGNGPVSVTDVHSPTITPARVHVTGPDGRTVPVGRPGGRQTIGRGDEVFTGAVSFRVATSGSYLVQVQPAVSTRVLIGRDIGAAFASVAGWFAAVAGAVLALIAGVVVLIVTGSRSRRAAAAGGWLPPEPGWYPDPGDPNRARWWTGRGWAP